MYWAPTVGELAAGTGVRGRCARGTGAGSWLGTRAAAGEAEATAREEPGRGGNSDGEGGPLAQSEV